MQKPEGFPQVSSFCGITELAEVVSWQKEDIEVIAVQIEDGKYVKRHIAAEATAVPVCR